MVAIDGKGGAGKRRSAERAFVQPPPRVPEAAAVAGGHFDIGQQMVAECHRLRRLQMGKAGHHGCGMGQRLPRKRLLVFGQRDIDGIDGGANPKPEIGRHLVVARTGRVQTPGGRPDEIGEPALDIHMDVFERAAEAERAALDF